MKNNSVSRSAFFNLRVLFGFVLTSAGAFLALAGLSLSSSPSARAQGTPRSAAQATVVWSDHNDVSPPLRDMAAWPRQILPENEAAENPLIVLPHVDSPDLTVEKGTMLRWMAPSIPATILNFAGISSPGVDCNCVPPDTNGEVGATQYVQIVNKGYQVFDKATGASLFGPVSIQVPWAGFGGVCETSGLGDPVVLYDQIANRWVITQFAGGGVPTVECIAVSTSEDATGSFNRYAFVLGTNFFDYPHLSVWPDAYYMSMNIFNSEATTYLGPQAFAFDRVKMLAGKPATFITFPPLGDTQSPFLPADLDGSTLPPANTPNPFVQFPDSDKYNTYHFHADFAKPANSTFTLFSSPPAAGFTLLCAGDPNCVPQAGAVYLNRLDALADRLMFRLAYRNFGDHEALVGSFTVSSGGVAGIRWFELRGVTSGPEEVFQEATYQPDSDWRWMGSVAQDGQGNMALGFSASSPTISPQIRYAGRLKSDPLGTLGQGEAHLYDGMGSQVNSGHRWGDYSDLTVDPVDDTTVWYTQEYYDVTSAFNWHTRIASFKVKPDGPNTLVSAVSRVVHGSVGYIDIPMPLSGTPGVEDRSVITYNAIFTFSARVTSGQVRVLSGTATAGAPKFRANTMTVPLTGVANAQTVTLRLHNINGNGNQAGDVPFSFLIADFNSNRIVHTGDLRAIKAELLRPVTSANFRADVTADGLISRTDLEAAKAVQGTSLP